jgi:hypothetical protein
MNESAVKHLREWHAWQSEIVALLRRDFLRELQSMTMDDLDWPSWQHLYYQGKSPRQAVETALERDL